MYYKDEKYNYYAAVKSDLFDYLKELADYDSFYYADIEDVYGDDNLINRVTGNIDGSYFCNAWMAEEALCHNFDFLLDALEEYGASYDFLKQGAEAADVIIRQYILTFEILPEYNTIEELYEDAEIPYES